jgi:hypothetical protein
MNETDGLRLVEALLGNEDQGGGKGTAASPKMSVATHVSFATLCFSQAIRLV